MGARVNRVQCSWRILRGACVLFVVVLIAVMTVACSKKGPRVDTVNVAIATAPVTLDPRLATDAESDKISSLICEGLLARDDKLELVPALAERYERVSDTSYRFYLRDKVVFSDNTPLTADDVVYTFRSVIDGPLVSPLKSVLTRIVAITAESPRVVRIDLKERYAPFLNMLTRGIVSKEAAEKVPEGLGFAPVCVGPYRVDHVIPESVVELETNDRYYGTKPKTPRLSFQVVKDDNIRVLKLMKGDIDLVQNAIPPMLIKELLATQTIRLVRASGIVVTYMGFNLKDTILSDLKVRRAIAHAINRDEIIAHRFQGYARKANSLLSPENWAYDSELKQLSYDPIEARKLLDEAGYPDEDGEGSKTRFKLTYKTSTVKERVDTARLIAQQLHDVGIDVRVTPYEWGTFFKDIRSGNFQMYTLSWVGIVDPDFFYETLHSSRFPPEGMNRGFFRNARIDELAEEGRRELSPEKRKAIYREIQRIMLEELPVIPLWYEDNVTLYRDNLQGVRVRPDASYRVFIDIVKNEP